MPSTTPYAFIEAETLARINALLSLSSAAGDTVYRTIPKVDANFDDQAFNKTNVRVAIMDVILELVSFICQTEGDPRRQQYKLEASVAHYGTLPSSMGPYGDIFYGQRQMVPRAASLVDQRAANPGNMYAVDVYFMAIDGTKLHCTKSPCTVEYFNLDRPYSTYAQLDALFDSTTDIAPIPDEFAVNVADGAAGRLAMKAGSYIEAAQAFLQTYYTGLQSRGLKVTQSDFQAQPAS